MSTKPIISIIFLTFPFVGMSQSNVLFQKWKLFEFYEVDTSKNIIDSTDFSASKARDLVSLVTRVSNVKNEFIEFFKDSTFTECNVLKSGKKEIISKGKIVKNRLIYSNRETSEIIYFDKTILIIGFGDVILAYVSKKEKIADLNLPDNYIFKYAKEYWPMRN